MEFLIKTYDDPDSIDTRSLAFLGDAILSLLARDKFIRMGTKPALLHEKTAGLVCAGFQAEMLHRISSELDEEEKNLVRRARNRSSRGPKKCHVTDYVQATGLEALMGWLAVNGRGERLVYLWRKSQEQ